MSNVFYLRNDQSLIKFKVDLGTTGNASTAPTLRRSGGSIILLPGSTAAANGKIPLSNLGVSVDLVGSALIVTTMILVGAKDDLDQVFQNLSMTVTLYGGLDGNQSYSITNAEKTVFKPTRSIVATKAIKLQNP